MYNKAVENYPHALEFFPECYETQKMCDKVVNRYFFVFDSIADKDKTQRMFDSVVSEELH